MVDISQMNFPGIGDTSSTTGACKVDFIQVSGVDNSRHHISKNLYSRIVDSRKVNCYSVRIQKMNVIYFYFYITYAELFFSVDKVVHSFDAHYINVVGLERLHDSH